MMKKWINIVSVSDLPDFFKKDFHRRELRGKISILLAPGTKKTGPVTGPA
jgi:hypothetical protein